MKNKFRKGMTLVELIVAIAILGLGMAAFTLLSVKAWVFKSYALEQVAATSSATKALNQVIHELRTVRQADDGSYAIKETDDSSLVVYRDEESDGSAERVHYFIEDGKLKKGITEFSIATGSYPVEDQTVKVLLNYVTNDDLTKKLFSYYSNGYPINPTVEMASPIPSDVRLIKIHLWVNIKPIVAPENVNFESVVELRNLNES